MEEMPLSQRLKQWSRRYKWPFIGLMWVIAIVLGYIGFTRYFSDTGQTRTVWDTLYVTLQLFTLESGPVPGPVGWALNIARFLAPLMAIFTAIQVVASIFREQVQMFRMRFLKGHVVICGLGRKGFLLSRAFRRRGENVVVIEQDAENDFIVHCRQDGIMVLLGNATDLAVLRQAGVKRARYVISVCGNDGTNAEIAAQVHRLVSRRHGKALSCLVHIYDLQFYNLVREREMAMGELDAFRLELFNVFESGSRLLLREYPPFSMTGDAYSLSPHILVVGIGRLGESIVVNSARTWWERHAEGADRLRITLLDNQAEIKKQLLSLRYPQLEKVCNLVAEQMDIKGPDFERADFLINRQGRPNVTVVYVCLDDDSNALSAALTLRQRLGSVEIPIVVRTAHESGLATLLQKRNLVHDSFVNLRPFGLLDRTCTPGLISECTYDILAQAVHQHYLDNERKKGSTPETNPSMVPWEDLPESLRESNLNQVEHIRIKLEAIGCDIAVTNEWDVPPFRFSPDEVELMAQMEHERFVAERKKQGFTDTPTKDLAKKKSPTLVSWHELPDSEKEKDRDAVRQLPEILAKARFRIYRFREKHE